MHYFYLKNLIDVSFGDLTYGQFSWMCHVFEKKKIFSLIRVKASMYIHKIFPGIVLFIFSTCLLVSPFALSWTKNGLQVSSKYISMCFSSVFCMKVGCCVIRRRKLLVTRFLHYELWLLVLWSVLLCLTEPYSPWISSSCWISSSQSLISLCAFAWLWFYLPF